MIILYALIHIITVLLEPVYAEHSVDETAMAFIPQDFIQFGDTGDWTLERLETGETYNTHWWKASFGTYRNSAVIFNLIPSMVAIFFSLFFIYFLPNREHPRVVHNSLRVTFG